jgi:hypothetical protein
MIKEELEAAFERLVLDNLGEAEEITGHSFFGLRTMIAERGVVTAACRLLEPSNIGQQFDGFTVFVEADLLRCSVESAVVAFADSGLLSEGVIRTAKTRLAIAKRKVAREKASKDQPLDQ